MLELDVNEVHYVVDPGQVFVCPSGMIINNVMISPDFKFHSMCLTDRIIQSLLATNVSTWNRAVYVRREKVVSPPPNADPRQGILFMQLLQGIVANKANPFREEMVRSMLQILLLGYCAMQKRLEDREAENPTLRFKSPQGRVLFNRFCELLREEEVKQKPV